MQNFRIRTLFASIAILAIAPMAHAEDVSPVQAIHHLQAESTSLAVREFYESLETRNSLIPEILRRARPQDTLTLKQAIASLDRDKKSIRLAQADGQLQVIDVYGEIVAEVSHLDDNGTSSFLINGQKFLKPTSGSLFGAIRNHLKTIGEKRSASMLSPLNLFLEKSHAVKSAATSSLPVYLYIDFYEANQTPPQAHSATEEVKNQADLIKQRVMPEASNNVLALAKRLALNQEGSLVCEASSAKGLARIDGQMQRFESRPNGDIILTPAFRDGPAVRLRPSQVDMSAAAKQLEYLSDEFARNRSPATALKIIDGPVRTICERVTMLKLKPAVSVICERAYEKKVSIEGRCLLVERGPSRVDCERSMGETLPQNAYLQFQNSLVQFIENELTTIREMGRSIANVKILGRRLYLAQCQDGTLCESVGATNAIEMVRPAPQSPSSSAARIIAKRHPASGEPLVRYSCTVQNETCASLVETEAARTLSPKDYEALRKDLREAKLSIYWRKEPFLSQASALRPLGHCCAEKSCRDLMSRTLGLKVNESSGQSLQKGIAK